MTPAKQFAERAFARSLHDPPSTIDECERLFAEAQADALRWAADQIGFGGDPESIRRFIQTEADRLSAETVKPRTNL